MKNCPKCQSKMIKKPRHKILCGDATKKEDVERLMNGQKADMVYTDPPYGMNLDTDFSDMKPESSFALEKSVKWGRKYKNVEGDSVDFNPAHIFELFSDCDEIFLWGADYYAERLDNKNYGSWIVWDKRENADGSNLDGMYGSCFELCWSKTKHRREIARIKWAMIFGIEKEFDKKRHHPTQKPIDLACWFFERWGKDKINIVDLYLGSGSTLIACEKTNRRCFGMEIEPHYVSVIIKRWETFTGKKAHKESES